MVWCSFLRSLSLQRHRAVLSYQYRFGQQDHIFFLHWSKAVDSQLRSFHLLLEWNCLFFKCLCIFQIGHARLVLLEACYALLKALVFFLDFLFLILIILYLVFLLCNLMALMYCFFLIIEFLKCVTWSCLYSKKVSLFLKGFLMSLFIMAWWWFLGHYWCPYLSLVFSKHR